MIQYFEFDDDFQNSDLVRTAAELKASIIVIINCLKPKLV
jgi:hypothetical protein